VNGALPETSKERDATGEGTVTGVGVGVGLGVGVGVGVGVGAAGPPHPATIATKTRKESVAANSLNRSIIHLRGNSTPALSTTTFAMSTLSRKSAGDIEATKASLVTPNSLDVLRPHLFSQQCFRAISSRRDVSVSAQPSVE